MTISAIRDILSAARGTINDYKACVGSERTGKLIGMRIMDTDRQICDLVIASRFTHERELRSALSLELGQQLSDYLRALEAVSA